MTIIIDGHEYESIMWANAKVGQIAFLKGTMSGKPYAYGPHIVFDPSTRVLRRMHFDPSGDFIHYPEELLVKKG